MPGKRKISRPKINWTYEMNMCLLECRDRVLAATKSDNPPRKDNGRKVGYMELMHTFFLEAFPGCSILNKQNLRDKISDAEKCKYSDKTQLNTLYETEVNSLECVECVEDTELLNDETNDRIDYYLAKPCNELECKAYEKAKSLFDSIISERGSMVNREWYTRVKRTPTNVDVLSVNKIVAMLIKYKEAILSDANEFSLLWTLNCIVYVSIIAWYLVNDVKCKIQNGKKGRLDTKPSWLIKIEKVIFEKRRLISKSVAEIDRLKNNSRITRKTKRNRKKIEGFIGKISIYSLTKFVCKLKAQIHRQAQSRKKKIANEKARKWNNDFHNNQSKVFKQFKDVIDKDSENLYPKFKESERERKYFTDPEEVLNFWKSLWCKVDSGNPDAEWLNEYTNLFESLIPEVSVKNLVVTLPDVTNAIKKKRNWSSPGPDLITNFWLKKLDVIHDLIKQIFSNVINNHRCEVERWYCCGRTGLLEKPGEWVFNNTRPITCTNNMYKWFTSLLLIFYNRHKEGFSIMQMDQRGAKDKCSGTMDNLLIDNMVLMDAHDHKRNLTCSWIDITKAYDSLSHSWIKKMLSVHRFPLKLQNIIAKLVDAWNITLIIPLKDEDKVSDPIDVSNGVLQGDVISPNLYTLAINPISWELRRYEGYKLSKPISQKITHSLFMDDLKNYSKSFNQQRNVLSDIKQKMGDASLLWNGKKCKVISIKRGVIDTSVSDMILPDGTKLECLNSEQTYKFLGVPENELHDVESLVESLKKTITQRASIIWSSPLSEYNKVMATNVFVHSVSEYYMWTEKFNIGDLRDFDKILRAILNSERAKYSLQMNASLYLPRSEGGRGLKNFETLYKKTRIKAAMNLLCGGDPRIQCVKQFDLARMNAGKSSIIGDAMRYAKDDFDITLEQSEEGFTVKVDKEGVTTSTSNKEPVKKLLRTQEIGMLLKEVHSSSWQGVILKNRHNDEALVKKAFTWLTKWKDCPADIINEIQSIHLQIIPTLTFQKFRSAKNIVSTDCRLCSSNEESVKHLLSSCEFFLATAYKRRHDRALQWILFHFLVQYNLIEECPAWYSKITIKPFYENEKVKLYWDIPEYSGNEEEEEDKVFRPDGKIILQDTKMIYVLEMSVPWIENRHYKFAEKERKYVDIVQSLKVDNPQFNVKQLTFIIDNLGGYSRDLIDSLKELNFNSRTIDMILYGMQKIVLTEATAMIRRFKIRTM